MRRREFVTLLGGAAVAWPKEVRAEQRGKLPTIGFLGAATPSAWSHWVAAFVQRLHELGWIEDRTLNASKLTTRLFPLLAKRKARTALDYRHLRVSSG
jgi:hypothetical protein